MQSWSKYGQGEIVVLLNNDVNPHSDFLLSVLPHFKDNQVFAVGFGEINSVDGEIVSGGRGVSKFERGWSLTGVQKTKRPLRPFGFPAAVWLLTKAFGINWVDLMNYSDRPMKKTGICAGKALKSGYKIVFEPKAIVEHFHESTNLKLFGKTKISLYSLKNQLLFCLEKYIFSVVSVKSFNLVAVSFDFNHDTDEGEYF